MKFLSAGLNIGWADVLFQKSLITKSLIGLAVENTFDLKVIGLKLYRASVDFSIRKKENIVSKPVTIFEDV